MNYLYEPSNICLTYGSIISFMFDKEATSRTQIISDSSESQNLDNKINTLNLKKEEFSDILKSREILYTQGVFNEFCFFYNFKDKNELKYNYYNSLFLVLPKGEYESMSKLKTLKKRIKKEIITDDLDIDKGQINHYYSKFKQEMYSNTENAIKILNSKDKYVNFNDSVQFMHIKSGKFLEFKKNTENLKIHIRLTDSLSENTIFHFVPAFNYQGENSANVMINLILKIACGEKQFSTENEKFLSKMDKKNKSLIADLNKNPDERKMPPRSKALSLGKDVLFKAIKIVEDVKIKAITKVKQSRISIRSYLNDEKTHEKIKNNFRKYINSSDIAFIDFGKKILPNEDETIIAGNKSLNYWRILSFSTNFIEDNKYITSLDFFCIQSCEKNLYIQSIGSYAYESRRKSKFSIDKNDRIIMNDEESFELPINQNIDINRRQSLSLDNNSQYIKDTYHTYNSEIKLNYFYNKEFNIDVNYSLIVNSFEENDYIEPLSLFKFEVVYNIGKYGIYEGNPKYTIDIIKDNSYVRLINVFTNKVLMIENFVTSGNNNIYMLRLVNNQEISSKDFLKSVFIIEKIQDYEELVNDDNKHNKKKKKKNKKSKQNRKEKKEKNLNINKNEFIKIKSKKFNIYIGIRLNNAQYKSNLVLTNSISDLTKFKLNCLDEIDKYELHFFEQLIWSFANIINYFKYEEKNITENTITYESYVNYEKIQHILIELEKRINNFPENNKVNISQKNKFDFMKAIEHFNIVSKLVDIFLAIWFHEIDNLNYNEMEQKLEKYFQISKEEDITLSKYKKLISKKIYKILKIIYDLNRSYLNVIVDRLLYFFMFVGRDDKCTKFLIHILRNNGTLLISLCPLFITNKDNQIFEYNNLSYSQNNQYLHFQNNNQNQFNINNINSINPQIGIMNNINNINNFNSINNINNINNLNKAINRNREENSDKFRFFKHCLQRIIKVYNNLDFVQFKINFSTIHLFFKLFNCLLIYNNKPFSQFYDEYFKDLELLKTVNGEVSPNYEKNPILVKFELKENKIYVKKRKFFNQKKPDIKQSFLKVVLNKIEGIPSQSFENDVEKYEALSNMSQNEEEFEFELSQLININSKKDAINNYSEIILSKLVSLNLIFYSHLSLCNQDLSTYLKSIFNFDDIINNYLIGNIVENHDDSITLAEDTINMNEEKNEKKQNYNISNDLKCSLTQLLNYLYFHISFPFMGKMDLFYCLEKNNFKNKQYLHSSIVHNAKPKFINETILNKIVDCISQLLKESTLPDLILNIDPFYLCQILECTKYILRNLYNYKNDDEKIEKSIYLVSLILLILEKFIGISSKEIIGPSNNIILSLSMIKNDVLETNDNLYLISDSSKLIFEKKRKKLEKIIRTKENISKKKLFKELFLIFISRKAEKKFFLDYENNKYRQKILDKLRQYELSQILMEISISRNNEYNSSIDDILFLISGIFLEFLQYIENLEIDKVFNKIEELNKSQIKINPGQNEDEFYDDLICSIVKENPEANSHTNIYLDKVIEQYFNNKADVKKLNEKQGNEKNLNEIIENESNDNEKYIDNISFFFFKFFHLIDNDKLKKEIIEILYKANSLRKIYYENITNIVLLDTVFEYKKLLKLKELFINIFNTMHSINLIKRLDNNSLTLFEELNIEFENIIKLLLDEKHWRRESNIFNVYGRMEEDNIEENKTKDVRRKSIFNSEIPQVNQQKFNQYYLSEFSKEKVNTTQQTLYNLGFINLINQIFEYISWVVNIRNNFNNELLSLESILISIYKLLVVFIFGNKKHQFIVKEKLNLYLCPLKLKNKSQDILSFIGYFLLNVVYFFETEEDFNQIKNLDKVISSLNILQYLEWEKNKRIIPFFVQSFKIIISFCNYEYFIMLYPVLEIINHVLVREIHRNTYTNEDLLSLVKILELIRIEQNKKFNDNKNTNILSLQEIIIFLNMINLINQKSVRKLMLLSQVFIIVTNLLYKHFELYKNDFQINKKYSKSLIETLLNFNEKFNITEDLVYCGQNKNDINIRYFNEFIGI